MAAAIDAEFKTSAVVKSGNSGEFTIWVDSKLAYTKTSEFPTNAEAISAVTDLLIPEG